MIGTPEGKSIQYVYANPQDREVLHPALVGEFMWKPQASKGRKSGKKKNKKQS
jgi:hypothetical protein